jgi:hypothetical protein
MPARYPAALPLAWTPPIVTERTDLLGDALTAAQLGDEIAMMLHRSGYQLFDRLRSNYGLAR